jgi:pentatricopeptide repeat protein
MLALAQISQPALAVEAFKWFKESSTPPSRQALTILFRCHLANHDVVAADQALDCLAKTGWNSGQPFVQAMLKGYRSLGFDGKLERRVLEEIAAGKLRYATSIINSLVQLRLDSDDIQGASALMRYIQLPDQVATEHGDSSDVSISFPKPKADVATFTILINMACRSDRLRLEQLEAIWRELLAACDSKDRLDGPSLRALVRGLVICGRPDEATSVLADIIGGRVNRWHTGQPRLSAQVFNALLRHRAVEEGLEGALDVLRMMAEAHVLPDSTTIRLLVTSFGWQAQAKPAAMAKLTGRLLKEIPSLKPDGQLLDILLQQAVAEETRRTHSQVDKDNQKARSATESSASGVIRDLVFPPCDQADQASDQNLPRFDPVAGIIVGADLESHYEPLFKTAVEVGAKSSAQAFVSRLALDKDRGTKPAPTAGDIYAIMLERGIKPSAAHFLQLMQGFVHGHKPEKAEDVFIMAAKVGIEPTISMWCVLIWGYGQAGDLAASFAALERMKRLGLEPNQFVYTSIGSAMLRRHEYRRADAFIRACWPRTEVVDSAFLEVAFHAKMRSGQYRQGVELLRAHAHIHWDRTLRDTIARTIKSHSKRQNGRATERELRAVLQSSSRPSKTIPLKFRDWSKPLAEALRMAVRSARNYGRIEEEGSCGGTDGTKGTKMKPTLH